MAKRSHRRKTHKKQAIRGGVPLGIGPSSVNSPLPSRSTSSPQPSAPPADFIHQDPYVMADIDKKNLTRAAEKSLDEDPTGPGGKRKRRSTRRRRQTKRR